MPPVPEELQRGLVRPKQGFQQRRLIAQTLFEIRDNEDGNLLALAAIVDHDLQVFPVLLDEARGGEELGWPNGGEWRREGERGGEKRRGEERRGEGRREEERRGKGIDLCCEGARDVV